jgi:ATP-binding cassette subfamily B protein/subfamily B ATP-binding cassette protein MsbA
VSVSYGAGQDALTGINLEVKSGETIAIVGPTGAGKTTLLNLLVRLHEPTHGRITLDGHDLRNLRVKAVREQVSIVMQEPFILPVTVAENIAYGRIGASREAVIRAAIAANAHEFIQRLPLGYDTVMSEHGASLSGGERQRLAIARAFVKDAPILILDEPTSALDAHTESLLVDALERLRKGRTTFIIAHRLSTIRGADQICVLDRGRVVQLGKHEDLKVCEGLYRGLYAAQAERTREHACELTPLLARPASNLRYAVAS